MGRDSLAPLLVVGLGLAGALSLVVALSAGSTSAEDSAREDELDAEPWEDGSIYGIAAPLLSALGWPYWWGGNPAGVTTWAQGHLGVDCSLFASLALVLLGLRQTFRRYTAASLAQACDAVAWGSQRPGDIAIYPGHVMLVASYPDAQGDSEVIGASGGDRSVHGDNHEARVKLFLTARYRRDFVTFGRLKMSERA